MTRSDRHESECGASHVRLVSMSGTEYSSCDWEDSRCTGTGTGTGTSTGTGTDADSMIGRSALVLGGARGMHQVAAAQNVGAQSEVTGRRACTPRASLLRALVAHCWHPARQQLGLRTSSPHRAQVMDAAQARASGFKDGQ